MSELSCAFVRSVDGALETCAEPSTEIRYNFPVCAEHLPEVIRASQKARRSTAIQSSKFHPLEAFPGFCYIILCPDATVKIGYSNTEETLEGRLKTLHRDIGPIVKLAVIPGGFVAEAVLHEKFDQWRIPDLQERFRYSTEMAEYISEITGV